MLTTGLEPVTLFKVQILSLLRLPISPSELRFIIIGLSGLEPPTTRLSSVRSATELQALFMFV